MVAFNANSYAKLWMNGEWITFVFFSAILNWWFIVYLISLTHVSLPKQVICVWIAETMRQHSAKGKNNSWSDGEQPRCSSCSSIGAPQHHHRPTPAQTNHQTSGYAKGSSITSGTPELALNNGQSADEALICRRPLDLRNFLYGSTVVGPCTCGRRATAHQHSWSWRSPW